VSETPGGPGGPGHDPPPAGPPSADEGAGRLYGDDSGPGPVVAPGGRVPASGADRRAEDAAFGRATVVMAVGTTLSRLTGLLRIFAAAYALGTAGLGDAYNLANTMPNIIQDVVLGGVLSATFVPVFVERLTTRDDDEAWDAISAVVTVTTIVIAVASLAFLALAPVLIHLTTAFDAAHGVVQQRRLATDLLWLFVPQLTCYGFISLGTALLNARRRFGAPMFTPIANNVVLVVVLVVFGTTVHDATVGTVARDQGRLLLLGLGTTAGVVLQAALMVPSLRRAGLRLRWRPDVHHEAVRTILRLSGWTFGLVLANQVALVVVLTLSGKVGPGAVTAYTYAYIFFQLPYGIVAVSIMSATVPDLSARWAVGDLAGFRRRMATGLRSMLAVVIPAAAGEVVLAKQLVALVLSHGDAAGGTAPTAQSLAMLALGIPGFCVFLYAVRVLQSVQDLRSAFWLYCLENGANIVLAVLLAGRFGVRGIALSITLAYTVAAVAALAYVRARVQGFDGAVVGRPLLRVLVSSAALVVAAVLGVNVSGADSTLALLVRVAVGAGAGLAAYVVTAGALAELARRRAEGTATPPPRPGRPGPGRGNAGTTPTLPPGAPSGAGPGAAPRGRRGRARNPGPPRPEPLPPAGRPPRRPAGLGPTRSPDTRPPDGGPPDGGPQPHGDAPL